MTNVFLTRKAWRDDYNTSSHTHTLSFVFLFLMLWATELAFTKFLLYEGLSQFTCQCWSCKRCRFDPWVGKIPWSRKCRPIPVFLPGKFHGQRSLWATVHGATESHHSLVFNLSCSHCRVKHLMCIYACKMCFAMWMHVLLFLFFWLHHAACGILVPWPGIASMP